MLYLCAVKPAKTNKKKPNKVTVVTDSWLCLHFQMEGGLGYGHWVCSMLLNSDRKDSNLYLYAIEQMGAIPAASDALAKYTGTEFTCYLLQNTRLLNLHQKKRARADLTS